MNASMRGQIILLFAASLILIVVVAGLLIDGGFLLSTHRKAQAAADTGALAAALAASKGEDPIGAARGVASSNGFVDPLVDCDGASVANQGVEVNRPPLSGPNQSSNYVEVITTRAMQTAFAKVIGLPCFLVSARAVARISSSSVATCSFCVLTRWAGDGSDNSFTMDNTGHLRVDGDILINGPAIPSCASAGPGDFRVCGTALHLYHTGGTPGDITHLSARTISIAGGWSSAAGTQAKADGLAADPDGSPCNWHPDPNGYLAAGYPTANVCVGMTPPIPDPFNDPLNADNQIDAPLASDYAPPEKGVGDCPNDGDDPDYPTVAIPTGSLGSPNKLNLSGTTPGGHFFTICPGLYFGGFSVVGDNRNVHVRMVKGTYFMVGGGFSVSGTASIDGSAGVFIYNSGGAESFAKYTDAGVGLVPTCTPGSPPPPECRILTADVTGPNSTNVEVAVTYTLTLTAPSSPPGMLKPTTGKVTFYDGDVPVTGCEDLDLQAVGSPASTTKAKATCPITYAEFGTRWITAVYSGDPIYAPIGDNKSTNVNPNANLGIQDVFLCTGPVCGATGSCTSGGPCNQILLHAPPPGRSYAGMLIFQDRSSSQPIRLWPGLGLPDCDGSGSPPSWMTDGVPGGPNPTADVPEPCGAIGGLSGTIYAPKSKTIGGSDGDATVNIQADGVANLQIIAGRISAFYNSDLRLAFRPEALANGSITLVE